MLDIILFQPNADGYTAICEIYNAANPQNPESVDNFKQYDSQPDSLHRNPRFVATWNGQLIAEASCIELQSDIFFYRYSILPDYETLEHHEQSIHAHLYAFAQQLLASRNPQRFLTNLAENHRRRLQFLQEQGFIVTSRTQVSFLDVSTIASEMIAQALSGMERLGYTVLSLPQFQTVNDNMDDEWPHKLHQLHNEIFADNPSLTHNQLSRQQFDTLLQHPRFCADAFFVVCMADEPVGLSYLWTTGEPTVFQTGTTGVLSMHRGQGIAMALKMKTIQFVQAQGGRLIETTNDEHNEPILKLNSKLGFVSQPALLTLQKDFA